MNFRIADIFTDSFSRLTGDEQYAGNTPEDWIAQFPKPELGGGDGQQPSGEEEMKVFRA